MPSLGPALLGGSRARWVHDKIVVGLRPRLNKAHGSSFSSVSQTWLFDKRHVLSYAPRSLQNGCSIWCSEGQ